MATREAKLIAYLSEKTGLPVSNTKEAGRTSEEYILVQRTNGSRVNKIDSRTYAIQSISSISKLRAAEIDETVVEAMELYENEPYISKCGLNSDYDFTDANTKEFRYQSVYDIVYF